MPEKLEANIDIIEAFQPLFRPHRYKSYYGGRGGAKSWAFAQALLVIASTRKVRVLCTREFQASIAESVHKLLSTQIDRLGLSKVFDVKKQSITSSIGSEFIFKGLNRNIQEIKSLEDIDICWVEEAQSTSEESWQVLIPTIRKENSEIWLSWNTGEADDPTYKRFVLNPPPDCVSIKVGWQDNPRFPNTLEKERVYCKQVDPDAYEHIWEGNTLHISDACIFRGKFEECEFETPTGMQFMYGADWGFSNDPTTLVRSFIADNNLYVDYEAYGVGVELDDIGELFDTVPDSRNYIIKADCARPDTINHVRKQGFALRPANKAGKMKVVGTSIKPAKGSVKEGIEFLRKFEMIYVHTRCKHTLEEFKHYSYKKDPKTNEVLPIVLDKWNHCFIAGTMVATDKGEIPIQNIKVGDMILTRAGYKPVVKTFDNGVQEVKDYWFANGRTVTATTSHNVITATGKKHIDDIGKHDTLYFLTGEENKWKILQAQNMKRSFTMGCLIADTQRAKEGMTGFITNALFMKKENTVQKHYTLHSGKTIMGMSQKACAYTIKMVIHLIMNWIIWNLKLVRHICQIMPKITTPHIKRKQKQTLITSDILHQSGIAVKQVYNGIKNTGKQLLQICYQKILFASTVIVPFQHYPMAQLGSVQINANQLLEEHQELIMKSESVLHVVNHLQLTNIKNKKYVLGNAQHVYNIMVEDQHEYFANGVLVANCIDSLRYAWDDKIKSGYDWAAVIGED